MSVDFFGLVYMSKSLTHWNRTELTDLLQQSRRNNLALEITGLLLYADGNFMQLLEGPRQSVENLMERIKKDSRHHEVQVLEEGPISGRQFTQWSMAFLDFATPQVRAIPGYSTYLETPFADGDVAQMALPGVRLLHYFKSVMTASDPSLLKLAESVEAERSEPLGNGHASEGAK